MNVWFHLQASKKRRLAPSRRRLGCRRSTAARIFSKSSKGGGQPPRDRPGEARRTRRTRRKLIQQVKNTRHSA
ncbi:hypothetical protein ACLB2K_062746 [Fragaria x ananassa]